MSALLLTCVKCVFGCGTHHYATDILAWAKGIVPINLPFRVQSLSTLLAYEQYH